MVRLRSAASVGLGARVRKRKPNRLRFVDPAHGPAHKARWRRGLSLAIRELRRACGATQLDLADAIGVDRTEVVYYERGRQLPSTYRLRQIAWALGTQLEVLCVEADRYASS